MRRLLWPALSMCASLGLLLAGRTVAGQEHESSQDSAALVPAAESPVAPAQLVVVRLTEEWFTSRIDKQIDELSPVDQVILNTRVRGTARTVGKPRVELRPDANNATLQVVLSGTTVSRTVGRNGPAIIHSRSTTAFT